MREKPIPENSEVLDACSVRLSVSSPLVSASAYAARRSRRCGPRKCNAQHANSDPSFHVAPSDDTRRKYERMCLFTPE